MVEQLGRREQPRLLVVGVAAESDFGQQIAQLVPTVRFLANSSELSSVRQREWDAAVLDGGWDAGLESHLFVLKFGGQQFDRFESDSTHWKIEVGPRTVATEFDVPDDVLVDVGRLIRSEVAPIAIERAESLSLVVSFAGGRGDVPIPTVAETISPFLVDPDGRVVAGRWTRQGDTGAEFWALPAYTINRERWLAAALAHWREVAPHSFPGEEAWSTSPEWRTSGEQAIDFEARELDRQWQVISADHDRAVADMEVRKQEVTQAADEHERRLLTAQGDDLVEEVIETLRRFGFEVVDVDRDVSAPNDRREDIRVSDPSVKDWIAIGEVRGYGKGAQVNDLLRLGRFVSRFTLEQHREPDGVWYVVNHFRERDPSSRPQPLESNPSEVSTFAEGGGLVIDTRTLFALRKQVSEDAIEAAEVRRRLREARGALG